MVKSNRPFALAARGMLILLAAGLLFLGWRAARTALYVRAALADLDRLQAAAADPSLDRLPALQADIAALETHLVETRAAGRPFLALARGLSWVPRYGADIAAAPPLLDMAVALAAAGRGALEALGPLAGLAAEGGGLDLLPDITAGLQEAVPQLAIAHARLFEAQALRHQVPPLSIDRLARLLAQLDKLLPLAMDGLEFAQLAPTLLGADSERAYLVLAQNSDELRATGGFISAVGVVRFRLGALAEMSFADSYAADNFSVPQLTPPAPLLEQMGLELWLVRDANWSPDFPQAAEVTRVIYSQNQSVWADGVIAIDLEAVRLLVEALGPLVVEAADEPVTGDNALAWMKGAWQAPVTGGLETEGVTADWWSNRKNFMSQLVAAALVKLESGGDLNVTALARAAFTMLERRHLQIYVDDLAIEALLAEHGWDGAIRPRPGEDFLAVIDSNVGFNKANALVRPAIDYTIRQEGAALVATAKITYNHTAPAGAEPVCDRAARYGDSYDALAQRCYWNYLRVYGPAGAELLSSEGLKHTVTEVGEGNTTVFAGDFVLKTGEQHTVTLTYRLPSELESAPYRLLVRKQAGLLATPLRIEAGPCLADTLLETDHHFECPSLAP
jgi:hypothetical protein